MTVKLSTGLRTNMLGMKAANVALLTNTSTGTTLAYADNGASSDTITRLAGSFLTDGLAPGMLITTAGSTTAGNDISDTALTNVEALTLTMATGTLAASENFAAGTALCAAKGGSIWDLLRHGVIKIYSSAQPDEADDAITGTLLGYVSASAGTWAHAAFANGLLFGTAASAVMDKDSSQTWQCTATATGTARSFRFVANPTDDLSESTTLCRIDGSVGTSGSGDLNFDSVLWTSGNTYTVDSFELTFPEYYGATS